MHPLLSEEHLVAIKTAIKNMDYSRITNAHSWLIILFFACRDAIEIGKIRRAVINSDQLSYTGIKGTMIEGGIESIDLSLLIMLT